MKCPKCGYLGFETSDKCKNCSYDFSLSVDQPIASELPLQNRDDSGSPLTDFDLAPAASITKPRQETPALDRLFGAAESSMDDAAIAPGIEPEASRPTSSAAVSTPPGVRSGGTSDRVLAVGAANDDEALTAPRPARPPLSVRRSTPDLARGRNRAPRPTRDDRGLSLQLEEAAPTPPPEVEAPSPDLTAGLMMRVIAAVIDGVLLLMLNVAVVYFTMQIAGLELLEIGLIPPVPMLAFLLMLNGGYLIAFTAAAGQTVGKMATSIRVTGDDGSRVDLTGSVLRALGCAISVATFGLGFLPALFGGQRRALQDRLAGTRVVRVETS